MITILIKQAAGLWRMALTPGYKNISLSYNVPAHILGATKVIKGLRATIGAQNIFTITNYSGYDPEIGAYVGTGSSSANQAVGIDFGRYPLTPMYNFALSVNF